MKTKIEILNLKCGGCANSIKKGLLTVDGVQDAQVNLETSEVTIETLNKKVLEEVKIKLSSMGYPEAGDANTIMHKAKSFVSCATGRMTAESE